MKFKQTDTQYKIKTVKPGDSNWYITGEITITPRAGFEISMHCPNSYREVIEQCVNNGWLKPVAYMKDSEYMWETLQK